MDNNIKNAGYNAEQMEYSLGDDVLSRIVNFLDFMEQCTCSEPKWVKSCQSTLKTGKLSSKCESCSEGCCYSTNKNNI